MYGMTFIYHFRLLMHFKGMKPMNMPFFLLKILTKMANKVQENPDASSTRVFHHGLIKLMILGELQRVGKKWDYLLFWGDFRT